MSKNLLFTATSFFALFAGGLIQSFYKITKRKNYITELFDNVSNDKNFIYCNISSNNRISRNKRNYPLELFSRFQCAKYIHKYIQLEAFRTQQTNNNYLFNV